MASKKLKKKYIFIIIASIFVFFLCACQKKDSIENIEKNDSMQMIKGYDLPVEEKERKEAEMDCREMMELIFDIYENADKGTDSNVVLSDETIFKMQEKVGETGAPVYTSVLYSDMKNYKKMENYLAACFDGKSGSMIVYKIRADGGIGRMKYIFDGTDMFVLSANAVWNEENQAEISDVSHSRIKEWRYSKKGWFCYEMCVPEYPEVTEVVDGSCLIRVKPMTDENRKMSEKYVLGLGYKGNNLLCSNWDADHMEKLDYNGLYEYLYEMKYQKEFSSVDYSDGIPKTEFERLIMEYLPIKAEQIREYAAYDEEKETYPWVQLGCYNYAPTFFGTSFPEVTNIKENEDGTVTLIVDAVCEMILCDDAAITHELTIRFDKDGSFQYLSNKILKGRIRDIPEYQYRIVKKTSC